MFDKNVSRAGYFTEFYNSSKEALWMLTNFSQSMPAEVIKFPADFCVQTR